MIASSERNVLVITGLDREAKIVTGPRTQVVVSGGSRAALEQRLEALPPVRWTAIVSFGLAGALAPDLAPGDIVLATSVLSGRRQFPATEALCAAWQQRLSGAGLLSRRAAIAAVDAPVMSSAAKAALRAASGADAVDMESHIAAAFAERHSLPFGAIRVISDGADRTLPPVAAKAMRPDGGINLAAVLCGLLRRPGQLPALIATGRDAQIAFRQLAVLVAALRPDLQAGR